jgi:hypothetical protein
MRNQYVPRLAAVAAVGLALGAGCSKKDNPPPAGPQAAGEPDPSMCGEGTVLRDGKCEIAPVEKPGPRDIVAEFGGIADRMCECRDKACAESVNREFEGWLETNESAKGSREDQEKAKKIAERFTKCMMAAMVGSSPGEQPADVPASIPKEELGRKGIAMMAAMAAAIDDNRDDCAAMARAIDRVADENRDFMRDAKKVEDAHPEYKAWFDKTYGADVARLTKKMGPGMMSCGADADVQKSMKRLADDA